MTHAHDEDENELASTTSTPPDALPASPASKEAEAWCQPMNCGEHTPRKFVVIYEDADMGMAIFDNEAEAREHWEKANTNWNCYLMGALPIAHPPTDAVVSEALNHIRAAYEAAKYVPGDYPVQPVKTAEFMRAVGKILAAIPAGNGVPTWQPIETAPKEGTRFLAYEKGRYFDCWWHENGYGEAYWMDEADSEPNPSNWMLLPAPPLSTASTAGKG